MKNTRKPIALFMALLMLFSIVTPFSVSANTSDIRQQVNVFELEYAQANINSLVRFANIPQELRERLGFNDKTISAVKQLSDFNGEIYYIVEFEPFGYIIFDNAFTLPLILNGDGISPYINLYDNLIFGGPTHYYVKPDMQPRNGDTLFVHTVLDTELVADAIEMQMLQQESRMIYEAVELSTEATLDSSRSLVAPLTTYSGAFLRRWTVIIEANTTNFNREGNCGYVAAGLAVWYHRQARGFNTFARGGFNTGLIAEIQNGRPHTTIGPEVATALTQYARANGVNNLNAIAHIAPSSHYLFETIERDIPVVLLGRLPDPNLGSSGKMLHAVTVFGVEWFRHSIFSSDWYYFVHYGWGREYNNQVIHSSIATIQKGFAVHFER
ncbi:MAG: hypothetical protein FWE33_07260 [Defluviitaleaceae bacterium]|nr:hypothetical protein [Defluviitaleaceae bacterium]